MNSAIHGRKSLTSSKLFSNCRLSKYVENYPPPQISQTHSKASHHPNTGSATSQDHIKHPVVSTVPRTTENLTHSGLEREFVSWVSCDISDVCSAERSPASNLQQWSLAGNGVSGVQFPLSSGQSPIYSGHRRKPCTRLCTTVQTGLTDSH